jgi:HD-like signal output (HDOD) protein/ActR/RegA family two-component response regulator
VSITGPRQILFVDDDPEILSGLRVRLHRFDSRWAMRFAESGEAAIDELERFDYDLIIADVRMPGMDGVELLRTVSERWPHTIRIALSGYAGDKQVVRLVPYAHQYLNKPCGSPHLEELIERCLKLTELLSEPRLRALAGSVRALPVTLRAHMELEGVLSQENATIGAVAQVVASDTALTAKILQLANSEFFRLARRITNVEQAVGHLGLGVMRGLIASAEVFWQGAEHESAPLRLEELQLHADTVAAAARSLAKDTPYADDAWAAGLLHDVGYWVLARERQPELLKSLQLAAEEALPLHEAERRVLGASHAQLGAYLLGLWGLPMPVVEAVACHHTPESASQPQFGALGAIVVAESLCGKGDAETFHGRSAAGRVVDADYLKSVNAPFDWTEAARRVKASRRSLETPR